MSKSKTNSYRLGSLCIVMLVCSNWVVCAEPISNSRVNNYIRDLSAKSVEEVHAAIVGLAGLTPADIKEFRSANEKDEARRSLESSLPQILAATQQEDTMTVAFPALGSMAQLLGPERAAAYNAIEDCLFNAMKNVDYESRFRDRAGLALEGLPALRIETLEGIVQMAKNDAEPSKSAFTLLVKNCHREKLAKDALLELSASSDSRKRRLVAQEIVLSRNPGDELLEQLVKLTDSDPDEQVRSWAIGAFRTGYELRPELLNRLVAILSRTIRDSAEPPQNRQLAIGSLATLIRSAPEHILVLVEVCTDEQLSPELRGDAIGALPFASKYSPNIRTVLDDLAKSNDKLISDAGARGLSILEKRSK